MINTKFASQAIDTGTEDSTVYKIFRHYNFKQDSSWNKNLYHPLCHKLLQNIYFTNGHSVLCEKIYQQN